MEAQQTHFKFSYFSTKSHNPFAIFLYALFPMPTVASSLTCKLILMVPIGHLLPRFPLLKHRNTAVLQPDMPLLWCGKTLVSSNASALSRVCDHIQDTHGGQYIGQLRYHNSSLCYSRPLTHPFFCNCFAMFQDRNQCT